MRLTPWRAQRGGDGAGVDVHHRLRLGRGLLPAAAAHPRHRRAPQEVGQRQEAALPRRVARPRPVSLVGDVVGAQLVAVQQQRAACRRRRRRPAPAAASAPAASAKRAPSSRSRLPCIRPTGTPASRDGAQRGRDAGRERLAQLVVADPRVEEVAQHVERARRARRPPAERGERFAPAPGAPGERCRSEMNSVGRIGFTSPPVGGAGPRRRRRAGRRPGDPAAPRRAGADGQSRPRLPRRAR